MKPIPVLKCPWCHTVLESRKTMDKHMEGCHMRDTVTLFDIHLEVQTDFGRLSPKVTASKEIKPRQDAEALLKRPPRFWYSINEVGCYVYVPANADGELDKAVRQEGLRRLRAALSDKLVQLASEAQSQSTEDILKANHIGGL